MSHPRRTFNPKKCRRYGQPPLLPPSLIQYSPKWAYTRLHHFPSPGSRLRPRMHTLVVAIDGGCRPNERADPTATGAYAVYFGHPNHPDNHAARLDPKQAQTSNRAELRAAIAAVEIVERKRDEGDLDMVRELIVMTDSEYGVKSMSSWVWNWERNGWRKSSGGGAGVENVDLLVALHGLITALEGDGVSVRFWRVERKWNEKADGMVSEMLDKVR